MGLPTDLEYGSLKMKAYADEGNKPSLQDALDQLDEAHDIATKISKRPPLMRKNFGGGRPCTSTGTKQQRSAKAIFALEGVVYNWRSTTTKLKDEEGRILANAWNIEHL